MKINGPCPSSQVRLNARLDSKKICFVYPYLVRGQNLWCVWVYTQHYAWCKLWYLRYMPSTNYTTSQFKLSYHGITYPDPLHKFSSVDLLLIRRHLLIFRLMGVCCMLIARSFVLSERWERVEWWSMGTKKMKEKQIWPARGYSSSHYVLK